MVIESIITVIIGFSGGLAVGSGFVAFLTVLGVIPRLIQITKTATFIHFYEWAVISGAIAGAILSLNEVVLGWHEWILIPIGFASGTFIGLLAAALTEVLNVLPILARRVGVVEKIVFLLMAIVLGKVCGSLFHWIYFVNL